MKKILMVAFLICLSGCSYSPLEVAKAEYLCQENGGLYDIKKGPGRGFDIYHISCKDGKFIEIQNKVFMELAHPDVSEHLSKIEERE